VRKPPTTVRAAAYWQKHATDSEVSEFLKRVADPNYVSYFVRGETYTTTGLDTLDDAHALLARLQLAQVACTCDPRPSGRSAPVAWAAQTRLCPNYVEGDAV